MSLSASGTPTGDQTLELIPSTDNYGGTAGDFTYVGVPKDGSGDYSNCNVLNYGNWPGWPQSKILPKKAGDDLSIPQGTYKSGSYEMVVV